MVIIVSGRIGIFGNLLCNAAPRPDTETLEQHKVTCSWINRTGLGKYRLTKTNKNGQGLTGVKNDSATNLALAFNWNM